VILALIILVSVLSPIYGADTKSVELQGRRWGVLT
jgi:hypothetical protein